MVNTLLNSAAVIVSISILACGIPGAKIPTSFAIALAVKG